MFYKIFINNPKILLYVLKLKSMYIWKTWKKINTLMFKALRCVYVSEPTDRFIYEHIHTDLLF